MSEQNYQNIMNFFHQRPVLKKCVVAVNRFLPYGIAAAFFLFGILLFRQAGWKSAALFFAVPAVKFAVCTGVRAVINAPRPYDRFDFEPLVPVEKGKGKSLPSRHTASAFAIAAAFLRISLPLGLVFCALGVFVGLLRVLTGCHAPKDVLAALIFLL